MTIMQSRLAMERAAANWTGVIVASVYYQPPFGIVSTVRCSCGETFTTRPIEVVNGRRKTMLCHPCALKVLGVHRRIPDSKSGRARELGIARATLVARVKKYGMEHAIAMGPGDNRKPWNRPPGHVAKRNTPRNRPAAEGAPA